MQVVKSLPAHRRAPVDLLCVPSDSAERCIDHSGTIRLSPEDIAHFRFDGLRPTPPLDYS